MALIRVWPILIYRYQLIGIGVETAPNRYRFLEIDPYRYIYRLIGMLPVYRLILGIGRTLLSIIGTRTKSVYQKWVPEQKVSLKNGYQNKNWFGATWLLNQNDMLQVISEYRVRVLSSVVSLPESFYVMFFLIGSRIFKYLRRLSRPPWLFRISVYHVIQNNLLLLF